MQQHIKHSQSHIRCRRLLMVGAVAFLAMMTMMGLVGVASASPSAESSRWTLFEVNTNGDVAVTASRVVEGAPSACTGAPPAAHRDNYVVVSYASPSAGRKCVVAVQDPRIHFYEEGVAPRQQQQVHHHSHHHDHKTLRPEGSFALRLPLSVSDVDVGAVSHAKQDHLLQHPHGSNGASKGPHPATAEFRQRHLVLDHEQQTLRRTATTLGNAVVTISTSQFEVEGLQEVGDPSEQFNIILISSGYNGDQQRGTFQDSAVPELLSYLRNVSGLSSSIPMPFDVYYSTFNIYRVWFSSDEIGASKPAAGISVQNNLDCAYGPTLTTNLACSHAKVLLAASHAPPDPQRSLIIVLVKDTDEGGSGGSNIAVYASEAPKRYSTLLHQIGHAWAGVSDEYSYGIDEQAKVTMKNCNSQSFNTPWQAFTDNRVVPESKLGCTFNNYYGPTGGKCIMANVDQPSLCPVCTFYALQRLYDNGMKLVSPTYPHLDERIYVATGATVSLYINDVLPSMIKPDGTRRFETTWYVGTSDVAFNTHTYAFSRVVVGDYVVNVTIRDRTTVILDQDRQMYERRGANGPTAILQTYSFRVTVKAAVAAGDCTTKGAGSFGTTYCGRCDTDKTCAYEYTADPINGITVYTADLQGLEIWMVAVGIVFVVVGIVIFIVAWRVMTAHNESNPVEILPLTDNIMIVRNVLIAIQILVLLIATFTIFYCVYQYGQLTVFGQSILLGVIACAVVVWLGSYLGVVAAYYKSRSLLFVNFILLLLLFGCVLLFSVLLVYVLTNVNNSGVIDQLRSEWETAVENRPEAICDVQSYLQCSGFNNSCSAFAASSPGGSTYCPRNCAANTNTNPCLSYVQDFVKDHFGAASAGGWVLTALLLAALVLSVLLGCAIKNRRNVVHRERRVRHATGQNILLPEEIAMLRKEFNKIDKDGSGDISREEFSLFYNAVMGTDLSPRELEEYFDKLDADGNGNLSFEEFLKVYVPHREPRRKSMVKPKSVVEISSSSSSEEEIDVKPAAAPAPRDAAYKTETKHFDDDFAFEAPKPSARSDGGGLRQPPPTGLNLSQGGASSKATPRPGGGKSPRPNNDNYNYNQGGRSVASSSYQPTPQQFDLQGSYQSSQQRSGGGGPAAAPPPRVDLNHSGGGYNRSGGAFGAATSVGGSNNFYANADDLDLDIDMDEDFM